ncbi:MAG: hypothetical protein WC942_06455 [Clostridia bacterium]|jgi:hypothetical protein
MIIFKGTKTIGSSSFMIFSNEKDINITIPVNKETLRLFMFYFSSLEKRKDVEPKSDKA